MNLLVLHVIDQTLPETKHVHCHFQKQNMKNSKVISFKAGQKIWTFWFYMSLTRPFQKQNMFTATSKNKTSKNDRCFDCSSCFIIATKALGGSAWGVTQSPKVWARLRAQSASRGLQGHFGKTSGKRRKNIGIELWPYTCAVYMHICHVHM